jgi:hypothetical protein
VTAGTVTLTADVATTDVNFNVNINGGNVVVDAPQRLQLVEISRGRAAVNAGGSRTLYLGSLSVSDLGTLDLNDNDLVVNSGDFGTIQQLVFAGYSTAVDSTKTGIISSKGQRAAGTTILALFNNALFGISEWPAGSGNTIGPNAIVGHFTLIGDTDFDGQVTPQDYTAIDANLGATNIDPGMAWFYGDTDFDGNITPQDYTGIDAALGMTLGQLPMALAAQGGITARERAADLLIDG